MGSETAVGRAAIVGAILFRKAVERWSPGDHHSVHHDPPRRYQLRQQIEVPDIACEHARPKLPRLQVDQSVVEDPAFVAFAFG